MALDREQMLIVEDENTSRRILTNLFADTYEIHEAENGKEAYDWLECAQTIPSVILLDLIMPVMDGYTLMHLLQENEVWKKIPTVILTSEDSLASDQKLVELGACFIIHKPIKAGVVRGQINNIVAMSRKYTDSLQKIQFQQYLMSSRTNTFLCAYDFEREKMDISGDYHHFFGEHFLRVFGQEPFSLQEIVLQKDLGKAAHFFVLHRDIIQEEIRIKLRVDALHYEWFRITRMLQFYENKQQRQLIFLFSNIETEVEAQEKLEFIADSDLLTHIPNMRSFSDRVRNLMEEFPSEQFYFLSMDIYQFRQVNNLFGYREGDNVLKYLATKLQEVIESYPQGVYCRMASDVFYAFVPGKEHVEQLIRYLQECMQSYPLRFEFKLCFGIYQAEEPAESVEQMIKHSSYARLERKKMPIKFADGTGFYDEELRKKEYFEEVIISEKDMALKDEQFEVFLQPKCNLTTGKITGAEALVRWNHPKMGYLSPGIFIPIFEQNGFVTTLDLYVYEKVCQTLRSWMDTGKKLLPVSVNVSRCDLYNQELMEHILAMVERYQIPHDLIEFEITESTFISEKKLLPEFTSRLRQEGFHVLIDDFGSGYSSLNSLKEILVDTLKIDIKFLPVSMEEKRATIILSSVINMAQKLGMQVIAEGVETKEQMELLGFLGCPAVQGFYCYRPMPISVFEEKVQDGK